MITMNWLPIGLNWTISFKCLEMIIVVIWSYINKTELNWIELMSVENVIVIVQTFDEIFLLGSKRISNQLPQNIQRCKWSSVLFNGIFLHFLRLKKEKKGKLTSSWQILHHCIKRPWCVWGQWDFSGPAADWCLGMNPAGFSLADFQQSAECRSEVKHFNWISFMT